MNTYVYFISTDNFFSVFEVQILIKLEIYMKNNNFLCINNSKKYINYSYL